MCKGCEDCWHEYHCGLPQEGYDYDPDTCPYNPDNISKVKTMGTLERLKFINDEMKKYETKIFEFNHDDKNFKCFRGKIQPSEDGLYLTIRCGLPGIYTVLNEWKDNRWQMECADGSTTIAFDPTPIVLNSMEIMKNIEDENEE